MTVEQLVTTIVGSGVIYLLVDRIKVHIPEDKHIWLPEFALALGVILVLSAYYVTSPHSDEVWLIAALQGITTGLAAVGVNAAKKQHEV